MSLDFACHFCCFEIKGVFKLSAHSFKTQFFSSDFEHTWIKPVVMA